MIVQSTIVWTLLVVLTPPGSKDVTEKSRSGIDLAKQTITKAIRFFEGEGESEAKQEGPDRQLRESLIRMQNLASHAKNRMACLEAQLDEAFAEINARLSTNTDGTGVASTEKRNVRTPIQPHALAPMAQSTQAGTRPQERNSARSELVHGESEEMRSILKQAGRIRELAARLEADAERILKVLPEDSENTGTAGEVPAQRPVETPR